MRKTRLLSLMLVAAILLMGAGYALWHEDLKIDGEICTGELDFKFDAKYLGSHCYAEGSADVDDDGHTIQLSLSNMSPGEESKFKICIENTGTIGLEVEDVSVTATGDDNNALDQITINSMSVQDYFAEVLEGLILQPGDEACDTLVFYVDWEADEDTFPEDVCFDLLIEANVTQSCYEDYSNGGDEEPEPECPIGLTFVKSGAKCSGDKCYVEGELFYVFANGDKVSAGTIKEEIDCKKGTVKVWKKYSDACSKLWIKFTTDKHGALNNNGIK